MALMKKPAASLTVWAGDHLVIVKIAGRANFASSVDFKALVAGLRAQGYTRFVLDLSDCLLMDSTFLGVLAGMGLKFSQVPAEQQRPSIELLRPNARIEDLLENLGVSHLFKLLRDGGPDVQGMSPVEAAPHQADQNEVSRTCLEAHQVLMDINPENVPRFKDVARFLAEDLKRKQS